jgi:DNA-directed RNA polymerase sigma subunit (sigma70/sigma32)
MTVSRGEHVRSVLTRHAAVSRILDMLSDREKQVADQLMRHLSLKDGAKELGVTKERLRQIQERVLSKLADALLGPVEQEVK